MNALHNIFLKRFKVKNFVHSSSKDEKWLEDVLLLFYPKKTKKTEIFFFLFSSIWHLLSRESPKALTNSQPNYFFYLILFYFDFYFLFTYSSSYVVCTTLMGVEISFLRG
jgi:hypothetical protein